MNVPAKQVVDGVNVPLLKGGKIAKRPLYWHYPHYGNQGGEPSSIISQNDWKLIHYHEDGAMSCITWPTTRTRRPTWLSAKPSGPSSCTKNSTLGSRNQGTIPDQGHTGRLGQA